MQPEQSIPLVEEILSKQHVYRRFGSTIAASHRRRLGSAAVVTAAELLPLLAVLDAVQAQANSKSVFHSRRKKIQTHVAVAYAELHTARPRRLALRYTFQVLADLMRGETRDISPNELKQTAKEVALATLRHAPALINVAHQARLLA